MLTPPTSPAPLPASAIGRVAYVQDAASSVLIATMTPADPQFRGRYTVPSRPTTCCSWKCRQPGASGEGTAGTPASVNVAPPSSDLKHTRAGPTTKVGAGPFVHR